MTRKLFYTFAKRIALVSMLAISLSATPLRADESELDRRYIRFAERALIEQAKTLQGPEAKPSSPGALYRNVRRLVERGRDERAALVLAANRSLWLAKLDDEASPLYLRILLAYDLFSLASELIDAADEFGDPFLRSRLQYQLGAFYFDTGATAKALTQLGTIEAQEALKPDERDYATLIFGIALQQKKKHRDAIKYYDRIKPESPYFRHARLNAAVAFVRQGWWTDAQVAVNAALKHQNSALHDDMVDRLWLVLAYSQLQNEFYRNARESLRNIALDGPYVNRAMLALGLAALHQRDYGGAANAFSRLRRKSVNQLSVLESHMLLPYTYARAGSTQKAAPLFTDAVQFYQVKQQELRAQQALLNPQVPVDDQHLLQFANRDLKKRLRRLEAFRGSALPSALKKEAESLTRAYRERMTDQIREGLDKTLTHLDSYISQAQFGLAKIYDEK